MMQKISLVLFFCFLLTLPVSAETWYFAVVGDTQGPDLAEPVSPVFDKIIDEVNGIGEERGTEPDFLVHVGDKVCGSANPEVIRKQFLIYRQKAAKLDLPVYEAPGNHDLPSEGCYPVYREIIYPQRYYSFDHKGCHFVILSSEEKIGSCGALGQEQLDWLDKDLKECSGRPVFAFIHRPLYRGVIHPYALMDAEALERVFRRYKVKYLFVGHEHRFGIARRGGMIEYISGGGGGSLLNFSEESGGFYHFLIVEVEDGKPTVDFVKIDHPKTYRDFGSIFKAYQYLKKPDSK